MNRPLRTSTRASRRSDACCGPLRWILLVGLLSLATTGHVGATEIPTIKHTIDGGFNGATSVFAADVDGDGDVDFLGTAEFADDIAWWENPGGAATTDGTSWTKHIIDGSYNGAQSVFAADVDGDGDTDILGAARFDDAITWWENPGGAATTDGTVWTEHTIDGSIDSAVSVYAADMDGDGDTDILGAASGADDITWWENPGGAATTDGTTWAEHTIDGSFNGARSVYAADVDGDGDTDILGAASQAGDITWWENPGGAATTDGTAWTEHAIDDSFAGAYSVHAADVDGDGDTDILGAAQSDRDIAWWENPGGAATTDGTTWTQHVVEDSFAGASSVFGTDVDGDGDVDILGASIVEDEVAWWENPGGAATTDGTTWTEHTIAGNFDNVTSVFALDVDADGDMDILGSAFNDDDIAWWENDTIHRNASFPTEHPIDESFPGASSVYAADVDGDGDTDILGTAGSASDVVWWENDGAVPPTFTEHTVEDELNGPLSVFAADLDGDGDTDILAASAFADDIRWWENPGGEDTTDASLWTGHVVEGRFDGAISVLAADIDGDGDTDILGGAGGANDVTWWENDGAVPPAFTEHTVDDSFGGVFMVFAADVDGDGDTDIVGAADGDDDIAWWENPGGTATTDGTTWTKYTIDGSFVLARAVHAADMDGDGDIDILGAAAFADDITWWENPGGADTTDPTAWVEHTIDALFGGAQSVRAADMDADGDLDILGAAGLDDEIAWWENPGGTATTDGTPWTEHTVDGMFDGAIAVHPADIDGDGDLDLIGAALTAGDVAWWENGGGQFGLPTTDTSPALAAEGVLSEVLKITARHNGRSVDNPAELVTLDLLLEETAGDPLSDLEANAVIDSLRIYLDDDTGIGAGSFQAGEDTQLASISPLSLIDGVQTITFSDGDMDVEIPFGTDRCYFVVVEPAAASPIARILITHQTANTSTGEDADFDIPLKLEYTLETTATVRLEENQPPTANAGPDQFLHVPAGGVADVTLDGSGSMDADADPLTYTWTGPFPEGGGTVMGEMPMVTLGPGLHTISLTVDDGTGDSDTDSVDIDVNQMPVADAGADQLLQIPGGGAADVALDGSGSMDADTDPLTYTWTGPFPEGGGIVMGAAPMVTLPAGAHTVTLTVDDGNGATDADTVDIDVNQTPVADAGPDQVVQVAAGNTATVTLDGSASMDADTDALTYTWTGPFPEGGGSITGIGPMVTLGPGVHTVSLTIADGNGGLAGDTVEITVNQPPVANAGTDQLLQVPSGGTADVSLDGASTSDPDTDPLTYTWTGPFPEGGGTVMGVAPMVTLPAGVHTITLTVDDGKSAADSDTVEIVVNQPPIADAGPAQLLNVPAGETADVTLDGSGSSDPDTNPLTYTWTGPFPEGGGTVTGVSPVVTLAPGVHVVTLSVADGNEATDTDTVSIAVNQPTVAAAGPDQFVQVPSGATAEVTLDGSASLDLDDDPLTFTWTGPFPQGGGTVMGVMPTVTLGPGVHTISLTVDDGNGNVAGDTVVITVSDNQEPVANAGASQKHNAPGPTGLSVTLDGSGSVDPDSDPLTYTWTGPFGTVTGVSPAVPIPGGVHMITLTVDDGRGGVDSDTTTITVTTLLVSPSSLTFNMEKGQGTLSQPFTIQALGGTVSYSIARTATWLDGNPKSGQSSGEKDAFQAVINPSNLEPGTYTGRLSINGPGVIKQSLQVTLNVSEPDAGGILPPNPFANGVVDTADFIPFGEPGHPVAPQSIVSIFGKDFVAGGEFRAESLPLSTMLGGVVVTFDGVKAPLFLVSPGLIIAQMPAGVTSPSAEMIVENTFTKGVSEPREVQVTEFSPGVFTLSQDGDGQAIVVHAGTADLAAPVGTVGNSRPAMEGDNLTIYANGLGPVDPPIQDGHNSCELDGACESDGSNVVLHHTLTTPTIRIGGVEVPEENLLFSGSSPASVAINEVVFTVPPGLPTGDAVSLTIEIGGIVSKETTIAVE